MSGFTTKRTTTALAAALLLAALPVSSRAASARSAHTATLLTTGDVLIAGGVDGGGTVLNSADIFAASLSNSFAATGAMAVARASHTATLLPNGCVLVVGGATTGGAAIASAEVYDPATSSFGSVTGGPQLNLITARYNHTATLLNNGKVLICGGQDTAGAPITSAPGPSKSCEFYVPGATCRAGNFTSAPDIQLPRYNHTATLLKDGKVWFAGGSTTNAAGYQQTSTTERYDPSNGANGAFQSASPLIEARAYHTAVLMGDGKVLVSGGYNRRNTFENFGILESAEIYDPVANSVTPAAAMTARREMGTSVLQPNGGVLLAGGLGNITTTYTNPSGLLQNSSVVTGALTALTTTQLTGGTMKLGLDFLLSKPVQGEIVDGEIYLSSPSVHFGSGQTNFYPSTAPSPSPGIRINLNGQLVGCRTPGGGVANNCGYIHVDAASMSGIQGQTVFYPRNNLTPANTPAVQGGQLFYTSPLDSTNTSRPLTAGSNITTTIQIPMANELIGATVVAGAQVHLEAASFTQTSSFTVTIDNGLATLGATTILADSNGNGYMTFTANFGTLGGTVTWAGGSNTAYVAPANPTVPIGPGSVDLNATIGIRYVANQVDLTNQMFTVDTATVIIRSMIFADREYYNPKANQWSFSSPGGGADAVDALIDQRFGATGTLMPNGDTLIYGGKACNIPNCATQTASPFLGVQLLSSESNFTAGTGAIGVKRAFHTATQLPTGDILVAGGTNGPSILPSAELFNPITGNFTPTNTPMHYVRDLHTATLLPSGRVLLAGGFTTNATSTGSTNTVEIYYPETKTFVETTPMISSRSNHTALLLPNGDVFVAGGFGPGDVVTGTAEIFISTENRWVPAASMPAGCERAIHSAVQLKTGEIMLTGGVNASGILASAAKYNPTTNAWACGAVASMPSPLRSHTSTLLFDGRVLVAGGNDGFGEANASYTYSPLSNTWTTTSTTPLFEPRFNHTATLLPNGNVMITGGSQRFGNVPRSVETYHINGSSWVSNGVTFNQGPRAFHTMTLGLNNAMIGIGGSDGVIGGNGVSLWSTNENGYFTSIPDGYSKGAPPSIRQSSITTTSTTTFLPGTTLTVEGIQFRGGTEASGGGAGSANSAFSFPHLVLQQIDGSGGAASQSNGGFVVDLTTEIYKNSSNFATLNTSVTVALPATSAQLPYGWYALRVGANDIYSEGKLVQAGPARPASGPAGVSGLAQGISSITWSWNQMTGVDGYSVYNATTGVFLSTIPATATPKFFQTGLDPSATASILVAAYTMSGDGPLTASPTSYTLSTTPVNVTIASVTFSDLYLSWGTNGNASPGTIYEVSQSSDNFVTSFSTPVPALFALTTNFTTINNLAANTTYYFRVQAINPVGLASPFSASVSTRTRAGVTQPAVNSRTTYSINWRWIDPGGITNFKIYNATSGVLLGTVPGNTVTFNDTGLSTNSIRSIRVSAVTSAGEGPLSPSASAYTLAAPPALTNPAIPVVTMSTGSFQLNWTNNGNPLNTAYTVLFTAYDNNGVAISTFGGTTTGFNMGAGGLTPGGLYGYSLVATNGDGIDSSPAVVGSTYTFPNVPSPLRITGTTPSTISLDWSSNNNFSSTTYQVTYTTDNFTTSFSTPVPFALQFGGTNYQITGLLTSTSYTVQVVARNPYGQMSAVVQQTTTTFNGGAAAGSISGLITEANNSQILGTLGNGRAVNIRVPAHTFSSDVTITISSYQPVGTLCPNGTGIAFSITDNPLLQPVGSLYLTYSFLPAELGAIPASRALLMRYEPVSNTCVPLETTVDSANGRMTARINHFSLFQVAQVPTQVNADYARVFPNPFYANRDGFVTIDNVPPGARVRVFTLRGEQVMDQYANASGILTWSGTNGSGRSVASGVYLVMIESGSVKKVVKLALIR